MWFARAVVCVGAVLAGCTLIVKSDDLTAGGKRPTDAGGNDAGDTSLPDTSLFDVGLDTGSDAAPPPPSCAGGLVCGADSCCTSLLVPGGPFNRSYDPLRADYMDAGFKATLSSFRLDKYEVTVGRFRKFIESGAWRPTGGAGKHTHLNGGKGLAASGGAGYEAGWESPWDNNLPKSKTEWDTSLSLSCDMNMYATWTPSPGANEARPINCVSWYQAYAFCIADGGFLPSEAEWNFAAAGGMEHRSYPWGPTPPDVKHAIYDCNYMASGTCSGVINVAPVGSTPLGLGKWGQADLAGNLMEWTLDWHKAPYFETQCTDCTCTFMVVSPNRVVRGGGFDKPAEQLYAGNRYSLSPSARFRSYGFRCARAPY